MNQIPKSIFNRHKPSGGCRSAAGGKGKKGLLCSAIKIPGRNEILISFFFLTKKSWVIMGGSTKGVDEKAVFNYAVFC